MSSHTAPFPTGHPTAARHDTRRILGSEITKSLRLAWASRTGMYFEIPLFAVAYFIFLLFIGRGSIPEPLIAPTLIGMFAAIVLHQQITRTFWGVIGEMQAGTFERLHLSPTSPRLLMLARLVSTTLQSLAVATVLAVLVAVPAALLWDPHVRLGAHAAQLLVPVIAAVVGGAGLSLMVAGLTLLLRRLEVFVEMIFAAAFVFGGVLIPVSDLPTAMATAARLLFPITQPIAYARHILIDGHTLLSAQVDWGLAWLVGQAALLLLAGIVTYRLTEQVARRRGSLGRY